MSLPMTAVGLFAGIGGVEEGLRKTGAAIAELLVDSWPPARSVLQSQFPEAKLECDVVDLRSLPKTDVLTAGFPCTDLSQAGRTAGIQGQASGLVSNVFRLLKTADPTWLIFENVRNMLVLDKGRAMRYLVDELESRGYRWAYRLVDSRSTGVAQRRHRIILVASRHSNPADVLLTDDAGQPDDEAYREDAYGFYWTEGLRGLGWARDAVPPLKGGSSLGIPSPPAIWIPGAGLGHRLVLPSIEEAEELQGFSRGWTKAAATSSKGARWKLVGNAVTVGVSEWLGRRLLQQDEYDYSLGRRVLNERWPLAAWGADGQVHESPVSMWPIRSSYTHLLDVVDEHQARPLSHRATAGFYSRMQKAHLRFDDRFRTDVSDHADATS